MPNIWQLWHTEHKNGILSDIPNLKNYATLLQYRLKYETVWTIIAKWDNIILLRFSLSSSTDISLSVNSISFFSLCHFLSLPSPLCSRKLLKITLIPHCDLAADLASPRCWSRRLILHNSSSTSTTLTTDLQISLNRVMGVRFGMGFDVGFGSAFWIGVVWVVSWGFGSVGPGF